MNERVFLNFCEVMLSIHYPVHWNHTKYLFYAPVPSARQKFESSARQEFDMIFTRNKKYGMIIINIEKLL